MPPPLPTKRQPRAGNSGVETGGKATGAQGGGTNGNFGHTSTEVVVGDWNDNVVVVAATSPCSDSEEQRDNRTLNGNIGGPPPKLIPVSGQLEKVSATNVLAHINIYSSTNKECVKQMRGNLMTFF